MYETFSVRVLVPVLLRFALAVVFVYHGMEKVRGDEQHNTKIGSHWMQAHGVPDDQALPAALQLAVAFGELVGGLALALGLLTRYAAVGIIMIMAGAIATVHGSKGFGMQAGGFEYNFVIIIVATCLVLIGGGTFALDRILKIK